MSRSSSSKRYQVESIVGYQRNKGKDFYKVHWLGYSKEEDTWEPAENLDTCKNLIKLYMNKKAAEEKGKLLKQTDHYTLSSDEESNGTTITKTKAKRQVVKRVTRASVTPNKKIVKNESIKSSYNLRSGTADYSSEDESIFSTTRNSRKTRMSLSESKIKRQMAILKKDIHSSSQPRTSTPQKSPSKSHETTSSPSKLRATKKLVFESTKSLRARAADIPPMMTRRRRKQEIEASIVEEAPPISNDLKITQPPERSPKKVRINESVIEEYQPNEIKEEDQCFPVTWAEFALAAFVTGLAGLGYLCSSTDFCSYC